jgi:transposase-like protein
VTDAVTAEVTAWQARPLGPMYPVVFFDALRVKIREDAVVRNKAVYLALGVLPDGTRDILGLWIENTEGAKFWMKVFNELKTRGVADILIAVTGGFKGMAEAPGLGQGDSVFAFPPEVRKVIYTTNAIESINARPRKIIKTRGHFPSDDAATKLIWLALRNITADWGRAAHDWKNAMNQFAILYADRFTNASV